MAIEIVDFPIKNGGSFHCKMLVHQRVPEWHGWFLHWKHVPSCGDLYGCVWKLVENPKNPMVLLIIIPMKNGYAIIGNINPTFWDKPIWDFQVIFWWFACFSCRCAIKFYEDLGFMPQPVCHQAPDMEPWVQHVPMAVPKIISKWSEKKYFSKSNLEGGLNS